ncbi:TRAP transporter substrate-binding protein DctP [Aliamphritea hakodatensis]|uniref:TRAP transporter substrate-binding protein DctP n=1 Tax=Aliamphritea hakodatensis TaxID=2895352 RepID=UPI0022FD6EA2|nr:TRAP transporter substrate-binding protein DctP [Aliamphritea hakodatensis]
MLANKIKNAAVGLGFSAALTLSSGVTYAEEMILAHPMPAEHIFDHTSQIFTKKLADLNGDDISVNYQPGGALGDWTSLFEQTIQGEIPMTMTFASSEFDPRLNIFILGYISDNWDTAKSLYGPQGAMMDVYNDIYADLNMKLLAILPSDFGGVAIRKGVGAVPVNYPQDGEGLKIRVPPISLAQKRFELLGFDPIPMAFSELYTSLQLGAVDGRSFGPPSEIWQMRDVLETYIFTKDVFEHGFWLVNLDWWNDLNSEQQANIQGAVDHSVEWAWQEARNLSDKTLADIESYGIDVVELSPEQLENTKALLREEEWSWLQNETDAAFVAGVREKIAAK